MAVTASTLSAVLEQRGVAEGIQQLESYRTALQAVPGAVAPASAGVDRLSGSVAGMAQGTGVASAAAQHAAGALGQVAPAASAAASGMEQAGAGAAAFEGKAKGAGAAGESLGGIFGKIAATAGGFVLAGGIAELPGKLLDFANAAAEDEAATMRLQATVRSLGGDFDTQMQKVNAAIDAGQKLAFSDDEIRDSFNKLAQATGSTDEALSRQTVAMDLARGAHISLSEASKLLGKASDDNTQVLKRMGITLGDVSNEHEVLAAVQAKFAGQSAAFADSTAGKWAQAKIALSETGEAIGYVLLPALTAIGGAAAGALPHIQAFVGSLSSGPIGEAVHLLTEIPGPVLAGGAAMAATAVAFSAGSAALSALATAARAVGVAIAETNPVLLAVTVGVGLAVGLYEHFSGSTSTVSKEQKDFSQSLDSVTKSLADQVTEWQHHGQSTGDVLAKLHTAQDDAIATQKRLTDARAQYTLEQAHGAPIDDALRERLAKTDETYQQLTSDITKHAVNVRAYGVEIRTVEAQQTAAAASAEAAGKAFAGMVAPVTSIGTALGHAALEIKAFSEAAPTPAAEAATRAVEKAAADAGNAYAEAKRKQDDFLNKPSANETAARANLDVLKAEQSALDVLHDQHVINDTDYKVQSESIKKTADATGNYASFLHDTTAAVVAVDAAEKSGAISHERAAELLGQIQSGYRGLPDVVGTYRQSVDEVNRAHEDYAHTASMVVSGAKETHDAVLSTADAARAATSDLGGLNDGSGAAAIAVNSAADAINTGVATIPTATAAAVSATNDVLGTVGAGADAAASGNAAAIGSAIDAGLQPPVKGAVDSATAALESVGAGAAGPAAAEGVAVGLALAQGVSAGIGQGIGGAISAAVNLVGSAVAAARAAAGNPQSPSPVTRQVIGVPLGQGVSVGMDDTVPAAIEAAHHLVDAGVDAARQHLEQRAPEISHGFAASFGRALNTGGAAPVSDPGLALAGQLSAAQGTLASLQQSAASDAAARLVRDYEAALAKYLADQAAGAADLTASWEALQQKWDALQTAGAQVAEKAAQDAFDAWKRSQAGILAGQNDLYTGQLALWKLQSEAGKVAGLTLLDDHRQVNQQTLADDRATLATDAGLARQALADLTTAQANYNAARQKLDADTAAGVDKNTLDAEQVTVNSLQGQLSRQQEYYNGVMGLSGQARDAVVSDQQAIATAQSAGLSAALSQQNESFAIQRQVAAYNRAATDPTADPRARAQAGANAAAYPGLEQERYNLQQTLDRLQKQFDDPKNAGWSPEQKAELQNAILGTNNRLQTVNNQLGDLNVTSKGLPPELKGALATDFNRIVGALGLQAALQAQANGTLEEVAGKLPGGGGGGAGGPGSVAVAGVMTASQAEEINNQLMAKYMADQWARAFNVVMAAQAQSENAAFGAMLAKAQAAMLANLQAGLPANQGVYLPGEGPDPNADYGPTGYNAWQGRVAPGRGLGGSRGGADAAAFRELVGTLKPPDVTATINANFYMDGQMIASGVLPAVNLLLGQNLNLQMLGARR